ncbi:MAG: hypothetical protein NT061_02615 [Spirochaetes bacterium]|nr:hypothetical protein [Spirochaetota bacterium]
MKKSSKFAIVLGITAILAVLICVVAQYPTGKKETPPSGYTPIRDDELAVRCKPSFECPLAFGPILAVYYRAAKDESGVLHIAYHPVWAREWNDTKAWGPFLSRCLYTGGLSLQRAMYGKGDIESVGLAIDPAREAVIQIDYETAADYKPTSFGVTHLAVAKKGTFALPLRFEVVSWNHLFSLQEESPAAVEKPGTEPPLSYFTPELWTQYAMWKNPETLLRKDRAHFVWERGAAP